MAEFAWLLVGLLIGACLGVSGVCYVQMDRNCHYEQEIRRLRDELALQSSLNQNK